MQQSALEQKGLENKGTAGREVGRSVAARAREMSGAIAYAESICLLPSSWEKPDSIQAHGLHSVICQMQVRVLLVGGLSKIIQLPI